MSLEAIFGELLLDHSRHPRHFGKMESPDLTIEGANPLCGDEIELQIKTDGGRVTDIAFTGRACAICIASTSMFCENAVGQPIEFLDKARELFRRLLHGEELTAEEKWTLGDALSLSGVGKLPSRVKCATLIYETWAVMERRLKGDESVPKAAR